MTQYIQFTTDDGGTVLGEVEEEEVSPPPGLVKAGLGDKVKETVAKAHSSFKETIQKTIKYNVNAFEAMGDYREILIIANNLKQEIIENPQRFQELASRRTKIEDISQTVESSLADIFEPECKALDGHTLRSILMYPPAIPELEKRLEECEIVLNLLPK